MDAGNSERQRTLEICLILICIGLTCVLHLVSGFKLVVLNLFYLPIVIAAFFLDRYRAGVLVLFCVISATVITVLDLDGFAAYTSPIAVGLAVTLWGAVMGLNALLVGTLSDERAKKLQERHEASIGVVEVLCRYLNGGDLQREARSRRGVELSVETARRMNLSADEIDAIRIAAMLNGLEKVEITAKFKDKAIGEFGSRALHASDPRTFQGGDLVHSLGTVLSTARPLLLLERPAFELDMEADAQKADIPLGAKIIQTAAAYVRLTSDEEGHAKMDAAEALLELKADLETEHDPTVLDALEQSVLRGSGGQQKERSIEQVLEPVEI